MAHKSFSYQAQYDKDASRDGFGKRYFGIKGNMYTLAGVHTERSAVYGDAYSGKELEPAMWLNSIVDGAKEKLEWLQVARQEVLPEGNADMILPRRKSWMGASGLWQTSAAEYTSASEITFTSMATTDGVQVTPVNYNYGISLTNDAIRRNIVPLVEEARMQLAYRYEYLIDDMVRDAMLGTVSSSTAVIGATEMAAAAAGMQTIFGGDATDAADSLDAGDTLTTDMVAKSKRLLKSTKGYYWTGNTWTAVSSSYPTFPYSGPFVLYIAPEQAEVLETDSQFSNAAEYGGREVVLNGEIGQLKYLGVKIVETTKTPAIASSDKIYVTGSGTTTTFDTVSHMCAMVVPQVSVGMVWGRQKAARDRKSVV